MVIKSPLRSWSVVLPPSFTLHSLYEFVFRLTKGRYPKFELLHKDHRLPFSNTSISELISRSCAVFVAPLEADILVTTSQVTEDMCLVKIYKFSPVKASHAYWVSKNTTKTLAPVVFYDYLYEFSKDTSTSVGYPFAIWRNVYNEGDGHFRGSREYHWESLSDFLNYRFATGILHEESFLDDKDTEGNWLSRSREQRPVVLKLGLSRPRDRINGPQRSSRLDVLKQIFDVNKFVSVVNKAGIGEWETIV